MVFLNPISCISFSTKSYLSLVKSLSFLYNLPVGTLPNWVYISISSLHTGLLGLLDYLGLNLLVLGVYIYLLGFFRSLVLLWVYIISSGVYINSLSLLVLNLLGVFLFGVLYKFFWSLGFFRALYKFSLGLRFLGFCRVFLLGSFRALYKFSAYGWKNFYGVLMGHFRGHPPVGVFWEFGLTKNPISQKHCGK